MPYQAQDTFVADMDGVPVLVTKGAVFAAAHPVVKLDAGRGLLFKQLEPDEEPVPAKRPRGRPRKTPVALPADDVEEE